MEFVELGALSLREWVEVTGRDGAPFGAATAGLTFRAKEHHVGVRDDDGRLVGVAGATIATVRVEGHEPFEVVGLGSLIVRGDMRGRGVGLPLMNRVRALGERLGPDRAMIFCDVGLTALYEERGYTGIPGPVWVDQPGGRIRMPLPAMWRAYRPAEWPPGRVDVCGLPF